MLKSNETNHLYFPKSLLQDHIREKMKSSDLSDKYYGEAEPVKDISKNSRRFSLKSTSLDIPREILSNEVLDKEYSVKINKNKSKIPLHHLVEQGRNVAHDYSNNYLNRNNKYSNIKFQSKKSKENIPQNILRNQSDELTKSKQFQRMNSKTPPQSVKKLAPVASSNDFHPSIISETEDLSFFEGTSNEISVEYMDLSDDCDSVKDDLKQWENLVTSPILKHSLEFHSFNNKTQRNTIESTNKIKNDLSSDSGVVYSLSSPKQVISSKKSTICSISNHGSSQNIESFQRAKSKRSQMVVDDITKIPVQSLKIHSELSKSFENALEKSFQNCFNRKSDFNMNNNYEYMAFDNKFNIENKSLTTTTINKPLIMNTKENKPSFEQLNVSKKVKKSKKSLNIWNDYQQDLDRILERQISIRPKPIIVDESIDIYDKKGVNFRNSYIEEIPPQEVELIGKVLNDCISDNSKYNEDVLIDVILKISKNESSSQSTVSTPESKGSDKENQLPTSNSNQEQIKNDDLGIQSPNKIVNSNIKKVKEDVDISLPNKHCKSPSSFTKKLNHNSLFHPLK